MNGRERYFNTTFNWCNGRMAEWSETVLFSLEDVGMQVQNQAWLLPFFCFIVLLPFGFLLFILTADPVSFARFLRKHISSLLGFWLRHTSLVKVGNPISDGIVFVFHLA